MRPSYVLSERDVQSYDWLKGNSLMSIDQLNISLVV